MQTKSLLIICCKCTHHPLSQVWEAFTCISDVSWYLLQKCVWGGGKKAMPVNVLAISPQFTAKEFELPAGATLGYWPHFSFRFTCWQVDCLLYNSSWKDILRKKNWIFLWIVYSLNLIVSRKSSEGGSINEPLSSSAVLSNRLEPSCGCVQVPALYYQSLSDPLRLLEVMYSDASPSPSPRCVRPQQHVLGMRMLESSGQSRLWHRQLQAFVGDI